MKGVKGVELWEKRFEKTKMQKKRKTKGWNQKKGKIEKKD